MWIRLNLGAARIVFPDLPDWYFLGVAAVFGALVGSFLNVVIARLPRGLSIVRPASRCPGCLRPIAWYQNIPIASWIALGGRCRGCRMAISIRYPLVELATSLLAVACVRQFGPQPWALATFALLAALVALTYIDLDHWLLPRSLTIPFIALGLGASFLEGGPGIGSSAMGAAAGFAAFAVVGYVAERILKKEALGGGDLWLFAMIGAWLGAKSLLPVALLASLQGAVIGMILLAVARRKAARSGTTEDGRGPLSAGEAAVADPAGGPMGAVADAARGPLRTAADAAAATPIGETDGAETRRLDDYERSQGEAVDAGKAKSEVQDDRGGAGNEPMPLTAFPPPKPTGDAELDSWVPPEGAVPFGPFLALAAAQYLFFGERLVDWYLSALSFHG